MVSNLECVGLGVPDQETLLLLAEDAVAEGELRDRTDGVASYRWTDRSGARLTVGILDDQLRDLLPSYAGVAATRLAGITRLDDDGLVAADVVDEDGELLTRLACELEQWRAGGSEGLAAITGFGLDVTVHADEAAFAASDASRLGGGSEQRMAAESFLSYGLFGEQPDPYAWVSGVVTDSRTARTESTGQLFHVARTSVASLGMWVDVCLSGSDWPAAPEPGNVVAGTVHLVASIEEWWAQARGAQRRWFRRRR
jgi:hypothetical protein